MPLRAILKFSNEQWMAGGGINPLVDAAREASRGYGGQHRCPYLSGGINKAWGCHLADFVKRTRVNLYA